MTETEEDAKPEDDIHMGFFEHIAELRVRIVRALWGVLPCIFVAWYFREWLLDIISLPLAEAWKHLGFGAPRLNFTSPVDPFMAYLKISLIVGVLIASPWIFWQVWSFIAPGLYRRERRLALPFVIASTLCFGGGAFFGYLVVLPSGFEVLLSFAGVLPRGLKLEPTIMIDQYISFATSMLLAFGVVFEVPVVITFLAAARIVDWKQLLSFSRWWILISAILGAVLTPGGDVSTQMMMFVPLVVLYFISIGVAFFFGRKPTPSPESNAAN